MIEISLNDKRLEFADTNTITWFVSFCVKYFSAEKICKIYLFGNRVSGHSSISGVVREKSVHEFYVVLADDCSQELHTGGREWTIFDSKMHAERVSSSIGSIHALIVRATDFEKSSQDPGSFSGKALNGVKIVK